MRLLLDAHVSGRRIAAVLRREGYDVLAAGEERQLDGWDDERLLELATTERRIMVTLNVRDFARIASEWAGAGVGHAGCLMVVGIDHAEFGLVLRVIRGGTDAQPDQDAWAGHVAFGTREAGRDP